MPQESYQLRYGSTKFHHLITGHWIRDTNAEKEPSSLRHQKSWKVRSWKVVVGLHDTYPQNPAKSPWSLFEFCRAICHTPPEFLEVRLIPRDMDTGTLGSGYLNFETFVEPLRLLRNIPKVLIDDALASDVSDIDLFRTLMPNLAAHPKDEVNLRSELVDPMSSNQPVEYCFEMYRKLLKYAQAFERYEPYRAGMALERKLATAYNSKPEYGSHVPCCGRDQLRNPFKVTFTHPIEEALMRAKLASDVEDIEGFKDERKFIVGYLEPQFQRLPTAESQMVEFINYEKRPDRLLASDADLHPHAEDHVQAMAEAMILVDNLGTAMKRDMPQDIAIEMRVYRISYEIIYSDTYGGTAPADLQAAFDVNNIVWFVNTFKWAVECSEEYWFSMRQARMKLFEFDTLNQREPVDWTVDEPNIGAEFGVHVDAEDIELPDSDGDGGYSDSNPDHDSDDDSDGDSGAGSDGITHLDEFSEDANESDAVDDSADYEGESTSEDHGHV